MSKPKFPEGARVKVLPGRVAGIRPHEVFTTDCWVSQRMQYDVMDENGTRYCFYEEDLVLAEEPEFKVGDIVGVMYPNELRVSKGWRGLGCKVVEVLTLQEGPAYRLEAPGYSYTQVSLEKDLIPFRSQTPEEQTQWEVVDKKAASIPSAPPCPACGSVGTYYFGLCGHDCSNPGCRHNKQGRMVHGLQPKLVEEDYDDIPF